MGEEALRPERVKLLRPYQVNAALMEKTGKPETIFMHCLPAVRGEEVTSDVIDGKASRVWEEAENRKWTIKAIIYATLLGSSLL
jgi:ornithine carbamoyltransferase